MKRLAGIAVLAIMLIVSGAPAQDLNQWRSSDWMDFIEEAVENIIDYGLERGAAGGIGGAMPLTDLYSGLAALPPATREGLRRMLEGRMLRYADGDAEDLKKLDLYQAYYTALTTGDRTRLNELKEQHQRVRDAMARSERDRLGISMEPGINRPGRDYRSFDLDAAQPSLCQSACVGDAMCHAWTYVAPHTVQGPRPRCWLKSSVPDPEVNPCCTSGVVPRGTVPSSSAGRLPATIELCETGNREICATLRWDQLSGSYDMRGANGAHGVIAVRAFGPSGISMSRVDRDGVSAGLTATYQGRVTGSNIGAGQVTWTWTWGGARQTRAGTWRARW